MIMVKDMKEFGQDASSETMQRIAGEFRTYADNPTCILCESLV
ncbi:MAG: REDY-like protein HapK [Rhodospirillales bacterium]|nr:REDY-like protein HapK [Rhodospirillales bacterium]